MNKTRVIIYGVGKVGSVAVRIMASRKWMEIAGAIDSDKSQVGRDLGEVVGLDRKLGITVSDDPGAVFHQARAQVALHTTSLMDPEVAQSQILQALEAGCNVISTTDYRLIFPWVHNPEWGKRVDETAKRKGITFLETGINPGFISDFIPIVYTGACASVKGVKTTITTTLFGQSPSMLAYLGFGITPDELQKGVANGTIHSPLVAKGPRQLYIIADALGWKLDEVTRTVEPRAAERRMVLSSGQAIEPGKVYRYVAVHSGLKDTEPVVTLTLDYQVGVKAEEESYVVETHIEGEPNIHVVTKGLKIPVVTAARAVNYIPQVLAARPGLVTIRELPVAAALE